MVILSFGPKSSEPGTVVTNLGGQNNLAMGLTLQQNGDIVVVGALDALKNLFSHTH